MERVTPLEQSHFLHVFIPGWERHKRSDRNTLLLCPDNNEMKKIATGTRQLLKDFRMNVTIKSQPAD